MPATKSSDAKATFWIKATSSDGALPDLSVKAAIVEEALSELTRMRIEFLCRDRALSLRGLLGQQVTLGYAEPDAELRQFHGLCVQAEYIGTYQGMARFVMEVRPRFWFLTRQADCKVFQGKTTSAIVQEVTQADGFSSNLKLNLDGSYAPRPYCIQYRETDFAFVSRLMEEEGIYYYFTHDGASENMVLADSPGQHKPLPGGSRLEYVETEVVEFEYRDQVFEWQALDQATTGEVSLVSYNFENPGQSLLVKRAKPFGAHPHVGVERYDNEGRYYSTGDGETRAKVRIEREAMLAQTWAGVSNACQIAPGFTFSLTNGPRPKENADFLVTRAVHYIQREEDARQHVVGQHAVGRALDLGRHTDKTYRCEFQAIPKATQFRPARVTPWPEIAGVHTALVVGPAGEEIHTDKYGRICIQFHWDRLGPKSDKSSIWVRTMMPWTGKQWGMIHIPRIGNEVVVQFEEGDPDRPLVTGMLYNADNMPPYALPDNKTQSGVLTNSSKGGNGANELMFEDKKGKELVRFHAEKDYQQVVENNARIVIGKDKKDAGDLTQWVHRNRTSIVGLIDSDVTGAVKSTAVGGAIAETVLGVKTQAIGYHKYESVGIKLKGLPALGWAIDGLSTATTVASSVLEDGGAGAFDELDGLLGSTGVVSALWSGASSYGSIVGPALAAIIGTAQAKGLKPGKTEDIFGNSSLTVERNMMADGDRTITIKDGKLETTVDKGDMLTTVKKGKHFLKVETGPQIVSVLKGDRQIGVATGDLITGVDKGAYKETVSLGNYSMDVKKGNIEVKADLGAITIEAMQKITLKVGPSKIELTPMGIKIEGPTVTVDGKTVTEVKGGVSTIVKGAFVLIN